MLFIIGVRVLHPVDRTLTERVTEFHMARDGPMEPGPATPHAAHPGQHAGGGAIYPTM